MREKYKPKILVYTFCLGVILSPINFIFSQNNNSKVKLGFNIEMFGKILKDSRNKTKFQTDLPISFYFDLSIEPTNQFEISFRSGYSFIEDFTGIELGGYLKYFTSSNHNFFLIGGINFHFNSPVGHGSHINNDATFILPGIGIGIKTGRNSSLELIYFIPSPKELKTDTEINFDTGEITTIKTNFIGLIKFGLGFNWGI